MVLFVEAAVLIVALWFASKMASRIVRVRFLDKTPLEEGRKYAFQRLVSYSLFLLGSLVGIHSLGLDLSSLAFFSGALGIGVGLGFQQIAKNFAAGLILLFEQRIKVGDRIEVGQGPGDQGMALQGNVVSIGSRATLVRTNANVVIVVPNSLFLENQVTNLTLNDRSVRIDLPVGVSYSSDPEQVRAVLVGVANSHPDVQEDPQPDAIFTGFGDSSLDFELRVWTTKRVTSPRVIASEIYFEAFRELGEAGIEIPFPQRDVHVRSVSSGIPAAAQPQPEGHRPPTRDGSGEGQA